MDLKEPFPDWLAPMAATLTQERFTGPEWIFEQKFDGIRLITFKNGNSVELFSRNHLPQHIPSIVQAITKLPHQQLILDGEVTWRHGIVRYHVFDVLWLDGESVTSKPLTDRHRASKIPGLHDLPATSVRCGSGLRAG